MEDLSSFSFIFVGDTHGFISDFLKQEEIINAVDPEYVLSEQLQDIVLDSEEAYLSIFKKKKISEMVKFEEIKDLLDLCHKKKIRLIGMDLRNFGLDLRLKLVVRDEKKASREDNERMSEIVKERQNHHLKIINKYKTLTEKPIVILLGSWHLHETSLLMRSLNNYIVIYPSDVQGKLLTKPPKDKNQVRYGIKVKR